MNRYITQHYNVYWYFEISISQYVYDQSPREGREQVQFKLKNCYLLSRQ